MAAEAEAEAEAQAKAAAQAPAAEFVPRAAVASRAVVAVDVDDVLAQFAPALARWHNESFGSRLALGDFVSYEFHEVWGGSREECAAKMERFFASTHFAALEPVPLAQRALTELREEFTLVVVTSRQHALAPATRAWLQRHFPDTFSHVAFGNHYGAGARASKRELCRALGAVALVDDNPRYVAECAEEAGFTGVLFDADYPWARRAEPERAHRNVARVRDWPAAARALRAALRR